MEYHEIGDRFEFYGAVLELIEGEGTVTDCMNCYFRLFNCSALKGTWCNKRLRLDGTPAYYKLVEQCKPKEKTI